MARHPGLDKRSIPVVILANKQDADNHVDELTLRKIIKLDALKAMKPSLKWFIKNTTGIKGHGVNDCFVVFEEE